MSDDFSTYGMAKVEVKEGLDKPPDEPHLTWTKTKDVATGATIFSLIIPQHFFETVENPNLRLAILVRKLAEQLDPEGVTEGY